MFMSVLLVFYPNWFIITAVDGLSICTATNVQIFSIVHELVVGSL